MVAPAIAKRKTTTRAATMTTMKVRTVMRCQKAKHMRGAAAAGLLSEVHGGAFFIFMGESKPAAAAQIRRYEN